MSSKQTIVIRNIYYMLAYAFQALRQTNYKRIETESFENAQDLFASILYIGVSQQLKRGLNKEYINLDEDLRVLRGKLNFPETIKIRSLNKRQILSCNHDSLSADNYLNSVIKTTLQYLSKNKNVKKETRLGLRNILRLLHDIRLVNLNDVKWEQIRYHKNTKSYELLINICHFVYSESLLTQMQGNNKTFSFSDDNMAKVYEKFILEYYRRHHKELRPRSSEIKWNLDDSFPNTDSKYLPAMQSDITLRKNEKTLIIDAKYYSNAMQQQFGKDTIRNNNLYQIYTYVKNEDINNTGNVSGMLLYAKTDADILPSADFSVSKNRIIVKTLDLNNDFKEIKRQLDAIANEFF